MAERILEKDFQRTVIDMARVLGWRVHAERAAMRQSGKWSTPIQGDAGFPDLVLAHPQKGVIFAELKSERGHTTEAQDDWLAVLRTAGQSRVYVWKPRDMDAIEKILKREPLR